MSSDESDDYDIIDDVEPEYMGADDGLDTLIVTADDEKSDDERVAV